MCGICGYSKSSGIPDKNTFEQMTDMIAYRGPNGRGVFYEKGLALGHRRLSILDLSSAGAQPFAFQKDYVCTYNGEIYNYLELRAELGQKGYTFATECDTEVLLAAYDYYGEACTQHFNGMWAFCIYDRKKNLLFCSRDRFGIKPFYYMERSGDFAFASEMKQLLIWNAEPSKANIEALRKFVVLGQLDGGEDTLFQDVFQLIGGHNLIYDLKNRTKKTVQWYTLPQTEIHESYEQACNRVRLAFDESIRLHLHADVPVGSCLSGGIDSSAIVGAIHEMLAAQGNQAKQHTVSSCYEEKAYNEQEYMDAVLEKTGAEKHKVFPQLGDSPTWVDQIIYHMDEPFGSASCFSQWEVFRAAQQANLTVMLDGQGADEQLAGYAQFYVVQMISLLRKHRFAEFRRAIRDYKLRVSQYQSVSTFALGCYCCIQAYLPQKLLYLMNMLQIRLHKAAVFSDKQWRDVLLKSQDYTITTPEEYIRSSLMEGGLQTLLHYEDRSSMAHSIEARVPFLDYRMVETICGTAFEYKIRNGITKAVFRDAAIDYLPKKVYNRYGKMGFPAPEGKWMQDHADWFRGELEKACEHFPQLFSAKKVMKGFNSFLKHPQHGEFVWWRIMCVGRWAQIFNVMGP